MIERVWRGRALWQALLAASLIVDAVVPLLLAGSVPAVAHGLRVPLSQAGFVFSGEFAGFILAVSSVGPLAGRWGWRPVATSAVGVLALGLWALGWAWSFAALLAAALVLGLGVGAVQAVCLELIPEGYPGRGDYGVLLSQALYSVGAVLGPWLLLGGSVAHWAAHFRSLAAAATVLFALLVAGAGKRPAADVPVPALSRRWRAALGSPVLRRSLVAIALYDGVEVSFWGWLFTAVTRSQGSSLRGVLELSTFWAAMGLGRYTLGRWSERVDLARVLPLQALAAVPVLVVGLLSPSAVFGLVGVAASGLLLSAIWPGIIAYTRTRVSDPPMASSLLMTASGLGGLWTPSVFGYAAAAFGWVTAATLLSLLLVPVAGLLVVGGGHRLGSVREPAA